MEILIVNNIKKTYGVDCVLEDVSFAVEKGDKVGVLGVNGAGKTTLFQIILGEIRPDEGSVVKQKGAQISYMPQQVDYVSERTAMEDVLTAFQSLREMEKRLDQYQEQMKTDHSEELIEKYTALNERYMSEGGLTYKGIAESTLIGLGISKTELNLPLKALSGGQRTRVLLARLILENPDILLLDEPTNHLDIEAIEWLENFLLTYKGTVLAISHDRYFLDKFTNKTLEIQNHGLKSYKGNYTAFMAKKAEDRMVAEREYKKLTRELKRIEGIIAEQRLWNTERAHITANSKQKMADRIAKRIIEPEKAPRHIRFRLKAEGRSGNDVLTAEGMKKSFDDTLLFQNVDIDVKWRERVFLLGKNGIGKTTFFRILTGELEADEGEVVFGAKVKPGYYSQTQDNLLPDKTVEETVYEQTELENLVDVRTVLGSFLFRGDDVDKKVGVLSGGEKARINLAILMVSGCNFLLLDEPTNHLDIPSREVLEEALLNYEGTLFIISHDRYFIQKLATRIYELDREGATPFPGGYDFYLEERNKKRFFEEEGERDRKKNGGLSDYQRKKNEESEKRQLLSKINRTEERIGKLEAETEELNRRLLSDEVATDYEKALQVAALLSEKQEELGQLYEDWEELLQKRTED